MKTKMWTRRQAVSGLVGAACAWGAPDAEAVTTGEVFRAGEGGYHTYRIPALLETKKGTLLAFCEGRRGRGAIRAILTCC
ncbi:MAG: exo-alpha-sialidase [Bryobacterales bacterium]|nr:exo-alpha-sialidase [Bryobacterales bacterium]